MNKSSLGSLLLHVCIEKLEKDSKITSNKKICVMIYLIHIYDLTLKTPVYHINLQKSYVDCKLCRFHQGIKTSTNHAKYLR